MSLTKATYAMITGAPVNVLDQGAVGDGVADDTQAIQRAINLCQNGGTVYFPPGTYKITSEFTLSPAYTGIVFLGAGMGATTITANYTGNVFNFTSTNNVALEYGGFVFRNMTINGNASTINAFYIKNRANILIDFVEVKNCSRAVMTADDASSNAVNDLTISNCRFVTCTNNSVLLRRCHGSRVFGTQMSSNDTSFIIENTISFTIDNLTLNGVWSTSGAEAMWIGGCQCITATNVYMEGTPSTAWYVMVANSLKYGGVVTSGCSSVFINNASAGVTAYTVNVAAGVVSGVWVVGGLSRATSGFVYIRDAVRQVNVIGPRADGGAAVFETAADFDNNFVMANDETRGEMVLNYASLNLWRYGSAFGGVGGVGSTATLGKVGGSGQPASAAQVGWMKIKDINSADAYIPVFQ